MSQKQNTLLISPPQFGTGQEKEVFEGYECAYCNGNGYHWSNIAEAEQVKKPCPKCRGTGKVKALVTIDWTPDGEIKNYFKETP